jgi:hypothetical protein
VTEGPSRHGIDRSGELEAVTARFWQAFVRGDADAALARTSLAPGTTFLGTAEKEFIDDAEQIRAVIKLNFDLLSSGR